MCSARTVCSRLGLRLTPIRSRVLELISRRHAPIGAYEILAALSDKDGALAPPTVYRALKFLLDAGLIHRVDSINAFVTCETPQRAHAGLFLVCHSCKRTIELADDSISRFMQQKIRSAGFTDQVRDIEVKGLCAECG